MPLFRKFSNILIYGFTGLCIFSFALRADESVTIDEKSWTSKDGQVLKAKLIKANDQNITISPIRRNTKMIVLSPDSLSLQDREWLAQQKKAAEDFLQNHTLKVKNVRWQADWYNRSYFSQVPELSMSELRLLEVFGMFDRLGVFAVSFTPSDIRIDSSRVSAQIDAEEGFAVKAKASPEWVFVDDQNTLSVRPKLMERGSTDKTRSVYTIGTKLRMLFSGGKSINTGVFGSKTGYLFEIENFEPSNRRY